MEYRDRDLADELPPPAPAEPPARDRPSLLDRVRRVLRDAVLRRVSTKR